MAGIARTSMIVLSTVAGLVLAGCGGAGGGSSGGVVASARAAEAPAGRSGEQRGVLVDVAGHVRTPGVYELERGARVHEALRAAGGARSGAQLARLNRAAEVVDGQQIVVPAPGEPVGAVAASGSGSGGQTVSLNSATVEQLDELPGIGPTTAERIVEDRTSNGPFASVADLDRVPGIGPGTLAELEGLVGP